MEVYAYIQQQSKAECSHSVLLSENLKILAYTQELATSAAFCRASSHLVKMKERVFRGLYYCIRMCLEQTNRTVALSY